MIIFIFVNKIYYLTKDNKESKEKKKINCYTWIHYINRWFSLLLEKIIISPNRLTPELVSGQGLPLLNSGKYYIRANSRDSRVK